MSKRCKKVIKASLTIEAALVLPIFIFACYSFLFFFYVIEIQENLHYASTKACEEISSYGYVMRLLEKEESNSEGEKEADEDIRDSNEDMTESNEVISDYNENGLQKSHLDELIDGDLKVLLYRVVDSALLKEYVKRNVVLSKSLEGCIVGGYGGISFDGSDLLDEDNYVNIIMSYQIKCPVFKGILPDFSVTQSVRMRSFNGYKVEKKDELQDDNVVYIAENGTVYHTHSDCSYIKIDLEMATYGSLDTRRNSGGAKYYPCESCIDKINKDEDWSYKQVYITSSGTRFHISTSCSKIKRSVTKIKRSEVGDKRVCSKCSTRGGGDN